MSATITRKITTLPEAKEALADLSSSVMALKDFVEHFQASLDGLSALRGLSKSFDYETPNGHTYSVQTQTPSQDKMTMVTRVIAIMNDLGRPVMAKEVLAEYRDRAWHKYNSKNIYNQIWSTMGYLVKRGVLVKTTFGYQVAQSTLPVNGTSNRNEMVPHQR